MYLMYLLLFKTQIKTKLQKTIAIDKANMKKALMMASGAGNVLGQPLPLAQQELLER